MASSWNSSDARVLGTYEGDGSKPPLSVYRTKYGVFRSDNHETSRGTIYAQAYMLVIGFGYLYVGLYWLFARFNSNFDQDIGLIKLWSPSIVIGLIVVLIMALDDRHYWYARIRYRAGAGEADYWAENVELRRSCVKPRTQGDFNKLLDHAEAADHEHAEQWVINTVCKSYQDLMLERRQEKIYDDTLRAFLELSPNRAREIVEASTRS